MASFNHAAILFQSSFDFLHMVPGGNDGQIQPVNASSTLVPNRYIINLLQYDTDLCDSGNLPPLTTG